MPVLFALNSNCAYEIRLSGEPTAPLIVIFPQFTADPGVRLFIGNPAAGREGLTLTAANVGVYLDRSFNLVDYVQSQDRIHRISQTEPCEIYLLVARDTVDEFIEFALAQKLRLARYVQQDAARLDPDDAALKKPDILRALLAPGRTR